MGYKKIPNLYKDRRILEFKKVYALEKIDGSWWSISRPNGKLNINIRGIAYELGIKTFSENVLSKLEGLGSNVIIYGEGYGGKIQGMSSVYGTDIRFVAFDVYVGGLKLDVPNAHDFCSNLDLDFVHYELISTDIDSVNAARDWPSKQAEKNGVGSYKESEGIILRPPFEVRMNNGEYIVAKHKKENRRETKTIRKLTDEELQILKEAQAIAEEWVTRERLLHVCSALQKSPMPENIPLIIPAMIQDIKDESEGEVVWTKNTNKAISRKTAELVKEYCKQCLNT